MLPLSIAVVGCVILLGAVVLFAQAQGAANTSRTATAVALAQEQSDRTAMVIRAAASTTTAQQMVLLTAIPVAQAGATGTATAQQHELAVAQQTAAGAATLAVASARQTAVTEVHGTATAVAVAVATSAARTTAAARSKATATAALRQAASATARALRSTNTPLPLSTAAPTFRPGPTTAISFPGTIAFAANDQGTLWSIYFLSGLDNTPRRLDTLDRVPGSKIDPVFSPDGSKLLFITEVDSDTRQIWIAARDGSAAANLTPSGRTELYPCWSPAGQQIAFVSAADDGKIKADELWQMRASGGDRRLIAQPGGFCAWSPDARLVYAIRAPGRLHIGLFEYPDAQILHYDQDTDLEFPAWAPDGSRLAFVRGGGSEREICLLDVVTGTISQLTHNNYVDTNPLWVSNDQLLYISEGGIAGNRDIYSMNLNPGTTPTPRLVFGGAARKFYLAWSPN